MFSRFVKFPLLSALIIAMLWSSVVFAEGKDLKVVITAAFVSQSGLPVYEEITRYLSDKLQQDVSIVTGISYAESDLLLQRGIVHIGFICGLPYTRAAKSGEYSLLVTPVMATKSGKFPDTKGYEDIPGKYYSYTIVRNDSPLNSWEELKGKTYAFNDKNSNSGYNMPRYKLIQMGYKSWNEFFSRVTISGSHEESIRLVAEGLVDASSVDSMVLDYDRHIGNKHALNVRIIEHLVPGGAGAPPVVISRSIDPELKARIQNVLVNMHKDPRGRKILDKVLISRFVIGLDDNYNDIRKMDKAARDVGFSDVVKN